MKATPAKSPAATIDAYLAPLPKAHRDLLSRIRAIVHETVPNAEETISYGLPTFRLDGKVFSYFAAAAAHCAIYAVPEKELQAELVGFETSGKGTVRFTPEHPIPDAVIRKVIELRLARLDRKASAKKAVSPKRPSTKRAAAQRPPAKRAVEKRAAVKRAPAK